MSFLEVISLEMSKLNLTLLTNILQNKYCKVYCRESSLQRMDVKVFVLGHVNKSIHLNNSKKLLLALNLLNGSIQKAMRHSRRGLSASVGHAYHIASSNTHTRTHPGLCVAY